MRVLIVLCFVLRYFFVHSYFAIILMGKKELVALLSLSSWCLVVVVWLFLAVPWVCLRFVIVAFSDHTHLLFISFLHLDFYVLGDNPWKSYGSFMQTKHSMCLDSHKS